MCQRKIWKAQEDEILKEIYEVKEIKRWSEIARIMEKEYGIQGRNGKQCRERYHNHLKGGINKEKWTPEEENDLIHLHAEHGNRWALISKLIPGRSQNCVKNMLYSRMRRSIRMLNRFIFDNYRKSLKEIKISFIYRLIDFTEKSYKKAAGYRNQQENISIELKNNLLMLDYNESQITHEQKQAIKKLISDIHVFKRVNQRYRGSTNSRKGQKSYGRINIDKKISDSSVSSQGSLVKQEASTPENSINMIVKIEPEDEKPMVKNLDYIADHHCQVTKVCRLDSLGVEIPFLQYKQSVLQKPIPVQVCEEPLQQIEPNAIEINNNFMENWQEYFIQFD